MLRKRAGRYLHHALGFRAVAVPRRHDGVLHEQQRMTDVLLHGDVDRRGNRGASTGDFGCIQ